MFIKRQIGLIKNFKKFINIKKKNIQIKIIFFFYNF